MANFEDLKKAMKVYRPAVMVDEVFSVQARRTILSWLSSFVTALFVGVVAVYLGSAQGIASFEEIKPKVLGTFSIVLSAWIFLALINAFYYSFLMRGMPMRLPETGDESEPRISYPASTVISLVKRDVTRGFLRSLYGKSVMARCGITPSNLKDFLNSKEEPLPSSVFSVEQNSKGTTTLSDIAKSLYENDKELAGFLARNSRDKGEFIGASMWVEEMFEDWRYSIRFWGREKLGAIPGIGKDWAYGGAYYLEKYASDITDIGGPQTIHENSFGRKEIGSRELSAIETVLSKNKEANVMLVGEDGGLKKDLVYRLARKIRNGSALPAIEHKRLFYFDGSSFVSNFQNKFNFESELRNILGDAIKAGNVILVIADFPTFLDNANRLGSDLVSIIEPYFSGSSLQVIALSNPGGFHNAIEPNISIMRIFEKVSIDVSSEYGAIRAVEIHALFVEQEEKVFFTYPAIATIVKSAFRYFPTGVMPDKAIDIVSEIVPKLKAEGKKIIEKEDVLRLVEEKTGIPTGSPDKEEKDKLLNLEKILKKRVVGQTEAINSLANALRRARSGITNPDRPIGSFLFLGPTGVGKTETTKALASAFFDGEEDIIRLDMSEYRTPDALSRLIGVFGTAQAGILSSKLREKPYGVLLLDEFEKTNPEVLDLFLQILDEGMFSDMVGKRVNAKNLIIIATSNAGSDVIWNMSKDNMVMDKDKIIDEIVQRAIYKPELLNRFDGVVVFKPLGKDEIEVIARLMLGKLEKRLSEKGIQLIVTEDLVGYVSKEGYDPKFGARPMNRVIQDKVEKIIAERMLRGEIGPGSKVELSAVDLR